MIKFTQQDAKDLSKFRELFCNVEEPEPLALIVERFKALPEFKEHRPDEAVFDKMLNAADAKAKLEAKTYAQSKKCLLMAIAELEKKESLAYAYGLLAVHRAGGSDE